MLGSMHWGCVGRHTMHVPSANIQYNLFSSIVYYHTLHFFDLWLFFLFMSLYVRLFCRGSVIAKIIGNNVLGKPDAFVERVLMYVYEEIVDGMKLTDIINTQHENTKYLPGCILPDNVVSMVSVLCKKLIQ